MPIGCLGMQENYALVLPFRGFKELLRLTCRSLFARAAAASEQGSATKLHLLLFFKEHSMRPVKALISFCVCLAVLFTLCAPAAHADKASAAIDAPQAATIGSTINIKVTVTHDANNFIHYTKWAHVLINGTEVARWDFSSFNRPESSIFTKEIQYTVTGQLTIAAEASCNIHGSKGPAAAAVSITEQGEST